VVRLLAHIEELEEGTGDGAAASLDPRTFQNLVRMAERHRSAKLIRCSLQALTRNTPDGSVMVAGRTLDEWISGWANTKADEFDPLVRGTEYVFDQLASTLRASRSGNGLRRCWKPKDRSALKFAV
jgi:hypothetical protein